MTCEIKHIGDIVIAVRIQKPRHNKLTYYDEFNAIGFDGAKTIIAQVYKPGIPIINGIPCFVLKTNATDVTFEKSGRKLAITEKYINKRKLIFLTVKTEK